MPVFIHSDFLIANTRRDHPLKERADDAIEEVRYERLITTEGMVSQYLDRTARAGGDLRRRAVEIARGLYLRQGTVRRMDFAQFTTALDAYRNEFRESALTLEDVIAVQLMRETDSTDILSANPEFERFGLRPLLA